MDLKLANFVQVNNRFHLKQIIKEKMNPNRLIHLIFVELQRNVPLDNNEK